MRFNFLHSPYILINERRYARIQAVTDFINCFCVVPLVVWVMVIQVKHNMGPITLYNTHPTLVIILSCFIFLQSVLVIWGNVIKFHLHRQRKEA